VKSAARPVDFNRGDRRFPPQAEVHAKVAGRKEPDRASDVIPEDPELQLRLAALLLTDGQVDQASAEFRTLLSRNANARIRDEAGRLSYLEHDHGVILRAPRSAKPVLGGNQGSRDGNTSPLHSPGCRRILDAERNSHMQIGGKRLTSLTALAAGLLGACGGRHDNTETYVLVTANTRIAYWQEAVQGLQAAAREMGVKWEMVGPETYDPKAEKEEFVKAAGRQVHPAGILVSAADPALMADAIDSAVATGIPVITIDADSPNSNRLTFIGTNNYQAGQTGGEILVKEMMGKGNFVIYTMPGQRNLDERLEGYKRVLARSPGIKIVEVVDIAGDPTKAFDATKRMLV